jgi:hypothetical protein
MDRVESWRRETLYIEADIRVNPWPAEFRLRRYRIRSITTLKPSWCGARVGAYGDALEPVTSTAHPADITSIHVRATARPGKRQFVTARNEDWDLEVLEKQLPKQRIFPFYSEVNSNNCLQAYGTRGMDATRPKPSDSKQGRVTHHAIQLARSFGIEPVKQAQVWFDDPGADQASVDERMNGCYGYRNLVVNGAIAPPIIWCASIPQPDCSYEPNHVFLQQINKLAPPGSMAWCADEPCADGIGNGMSVEAALSRVRLVQHYAPKLIPMITTGRYGLTRLQAMAADLPIRYCIVQNEDTPSLLSKQKGSYFSCMAQGCGESNGHKDRTPFPVAVVEGDPIDDFQAAIKLAHSNNALFALYYAITLRLATCWTNGGLYNEGGNGDGTAMYIHSPTGLAMPSIRLMRWHQAQQMIEKLMIEKQILLP